MKNGTPDRRSCRKTRSGWKMGGLIRVVAEKLDLDGKWDAR